MTEKINLVPIAANNASSTAKTDTIKPASSYENCVFNTTKNSEVVFKNPFMIEDSTDNKSRTSIPPQTVLNPDMVIKKAEELLAQNINEGNGKNLMLSQGRDEAWCADTVNYIYEKACGKTPFGLRKDGTYKSDVKELKDWGIENKRFKEASGEKKIKEQLQEMKKGDVIIWKSPFQIKLQGLGTVTRHSSHTGIVKEVSKDGVVSIIEGNANIFKKNAKGEYLLNHKKGAAPTVGKRQVINPYDGLIMKKYNANDLIESGYSGYIDMQNLK